jgi:hypothetical protein
MTSPAQMTPETISRIRGASAVQSAAEIARSLNWDIARVVRVAQAHSIDLPIISPVMNSHPAIDPPEPPIPTERRRNLSQSKFTWSALSLDEIAMRLSPRQAEVVLALKFDVDGQFMPMSALARRINPSFHAANVFDAIEKVTIKLVENDARWRIEGARGRGYRLITMRQESS